MEWGLDLKKMGLFSYAFLSGSSHHPRLPGWHETNLWPVSSLRHVLLPHVSPEAMDLPNHAQKSVTP